MDAEKKKRFDKEAYRKVRSFPTYSPIELNMSEFPSTGQLFDDLGIPKGFTVTPFIQDDSDNESRAGRHYDLSSRIARCSNCAGYINPYCDTTNIRWFCSICGHRNIFTRNQARYKHVDLRFLPETQDVLTDYRMPLSDNTGINGEKLGSLSSEDRPLVHVFLVQESMQLDTLQATTEALTTAINSMHPDIHVVLITFSHRIGIYSFSESSTVPIVEYVHFMSAQDTLEDEDLDEQGRIFEGHELHEISENYELTLLLPLSQVIDFRHVAKPIKKCREALLTAVSGLFDTFSSDSANLTANDDMLPKVMLGPTLEALGVWITTPPVAAEGLNTDLGDKYQGLNGIESDSSKGLNPTSSEFITGSLSVALSNLTHSILGTNAAQPSPRTSVSSKTSTNALGFNVKPSADQSILNFRRGSLGNLSGRNKGNSGNKGDLWDVTAPIDTCHGVILHLFLDSKQDIRVGSHVSAVADSRKEHSPEPSIRSMLDPVWVQQLATQFAKRFLTTNIWSVVGFESHEVGLSALRPLAELSGGIVHRSVLGTSPKLERARLSEMLRRSVITQYATRGLLRLRCTPLVKCHEESGVGAFLQDEDLQEVFQISSCHSESVFSLELQRNKRFIEGSGVSAMTVQMAFSYETMVEAVVGEEGETKLSSDNVHMEKKKEKIRGVVENEKQEKSKSGFLRNVLEFFSISGEAEEINQYGENSDIKINKLGKKKNNYLGRRCWSDQADSDRQIQKRQNCYSNEASLWVVRYLRVFTISIDSSSKLPRLFQNFDIPRSVTLIVRQAVNKSRELQMKKPSNLLGFQNDIWSHVIEKVDLNIPSVCYLISEAVYFLNGLSERVLIENNLSDGTKSKILLLEKTLEFDFVNEFLMFIYFIVDHIMSFKNQNYQQINDTKNEGLINFSDFLVEFEHILLNSHSKEVSKILSPTLVPLFSPTLELDQFQLPLQRESLIISGKSRFFLDAYTDFIYYLGFNASTADDFKGENETEPSTTPTQSNKNMQEFNSVDLNSIKKEKHKKQYTKEIKMNSTYEDSDDIIDENNETSELQKKMNNLEIFQHYLERRCNGSFFVPRFHLCQAGTASASFFSTFLHLDYPRSGLTFAEFRDYIVQVILKSEN